MQSKIITKIFCFEGLLPKHYICYNLKQVPKDGDTFHIFQIIHHMQNYFTVT